MVQCYIWYWHLADMESVVYVDLNEWSFLFV
jgi:hypothetical protein